MVDIINWEDASTTAADNLAVAGISDAEGWLPSTVNNFTRASWAVLAKFWDEYGGVVTVAGTADAITITTTGTHTALSTGLRFIFKAGADNTTAVTLNLDAIGAKAIRKISGGTDVALVAGDLKSGRRYDVVYDSAANSAAGAWILIDSTPLVFPATVTPNASDGAALGTSSLMWSDLFLASGGVINWNAGNVTVTHSAAALAYAGVGTFSITHTDAGNLGPVFKTVHDSSSPAASDQIGVWQMQAKDSAGTITTVVQFQGIWVDPTDSTESGRLDVYTVSGASQVNIASFTPTILGVGTNTAFSLTSGSTDGAYVEKAGRVVASANGDSAIGLRRRSSDGTTVTFHRDTTNVGTISVTTTNTAYNTSSDERLKEKFHDFDAGAIIDQMALYEYQWKADGSIGYGPKAQEMFGVFPLGVTPGNDKEPGEEGFEGWQWLGNPLVALCLKEIQSLRKRVAELEAA